MRVLFAALFALGAGSLSAAPITMPGTFIPSSPVVTFEDFSVGTGGPITVDEMTVTAPGWTVRSQRFVQYADIFEGQYFGQGVTTVTFDFSVDVSHFGFGLFDPNFADTRLEAYNRSGDLIETIFPAKGPPGGGFSTYTGFERLQGDIAQVLVVPQAGDLLGVDSIAWKVADQMPAVPLPASGVLLFVGLGGLAALRRRQR